jgi:hypothetical protein
MGTIIHGQSKWDFSYALVAGHITTIQQLEGTMGKVLGTRRKTWRVRPATTRYTSHRDWYFLTPLFFFLNRTGWAWIVSPIALTGTHVGFFHSVKFFTPALPERK